MIAKNLLNMEEIKLLINIHIYQYVLILYGFIIYTIYLLKIEYLHI